MPLTLYRADHRAVAIDAVITSPGDHITKLSGPILRAENFLRDASETLRNVRSTGLFAFTDYNWVFRYATMHGRYLYELEAEEDALLHAADMMLVNEIGDANDESSRQALIEQYLAGDQRGSQRVEYIVSTAKVIACHATPQDQKANVNKLYKLNRD